MHTHTKTALTNENDERELWPQHDHEIVYGVFLTFSSLSLPRTLLLWHQISCLSTVSIKIQHQYAPKWIESELINLNWAIGCITATATAVSRPFTAITLQRVHASAKKVHFLAIVCDNTQILEFTKGKKTSFDTHVLPIFLLKLSIQTIIWWGALSFVWYGLYTEYCVRFVSYFTSQLLLVFAVGFFCCCLMFFS